ncbi:DUF6492 family protein [Curvibacter sp. APW13]|uniref:DUF6492 family protein n=1 Tax=Curvibacter sp. APW13 TaxID=3077236 RepID=UPI0028DFABA0|nr:DUF6492 family protein [Curvibacter sp. APW13]MDT8991568.1 DUF6492 family protein [Curvibacter sp. APW13]
MKPLALYCKSYKTDLRRVVRLAISIQQYNSENIPFYVSVPQDEIPLFRDHLQSLVTLLIADEDILDASSHINRAKIAQLPGSTQQQIVKSEFWRLGFCTAYVCLDSDAFFIRPFGTRDFLASDGTPYTVIDEAHDLLEDALRHKKPRIIEAYRREADLVQGLFFRTGRRYSFGPFPLVWHRAVWDSLDEHYLSPRQISIADALAQVPIESRWYGEALLAYRAIPIIPCQALFKVYHYAWQYDKDRRNAVKMTNLADIYCGVILQSAWERNMDWPTEGGNLFSKLGRRIRRLAGRI